MSATTTRESAGAHVPRRRRTALAAEQRRRRVWRGHTCELDFAGDGGGTAHGDAARQQRPLPPATSRQPLLQPHHRLRTARTEPCAQGQRSQLQVAPARPTMRNGETLRADANLLRKLGVGLFAAKRHPHRRVRCLPATASAPHGAAHRCPPPPPRPISPPPPPPPPHLLARHTAARSRLPCSARSVPTTLAPTAACATNADAALVDPSLGARTIDLSRPRALERRPRSSALPPPPRLPDSGPDHSDGELIARRRARGRTGPSR